MSFRSHGSQALLMGEQETKLKIEQFIKCQSKLVCLAEVPSGD